MYAYVYMSELSFSSKIKCNYLSHLKLKHLKNIKEMEKREIKSKVFLNLNLLSNQNLPPNSIF